MWDFFNGIGNAFTGALQGIGNFLGLTPESQTNGSPIQSLTDPSGWWDQFKNGQTNTVNQKIAEENLAYQRERNEIEDARYEEETEYNRQFAEEEQAYQRQFALDEQTYQRQFAEDERAYNRALQQQLFDREDTAIQRQASALSSMGINPLSQQLNGLNAGQAVSSSLPNSSSAGVGSLPSMSSRGGQALHNDFKQQDFGMLPMLSALGSLADTVNGISTGQYTRDSLALQNDRMYLENLEKANELGIRYHHKEGLGNRLNMFGNYTAVDPDTDKPTQANDIFVNKNSTSYYKSVNDFNSEYYKYSKNINDSMDPKIRFINELANMDFSRLATDIMTNVIKTKNSLGEQFQKDFGKDNNPIAKFFSLFY